MGVPWRLTPPVVMVQGLLGQGHPMQGGAPNPARLKGEDFTSIFVLQFAPNGTLLPIVWEDSVAITLPAAPARPHP